MQYFGVPKCPYCKKRVNLIRTWSLKRQGEYRCPRCGGISNIFLSPLIYVFALLAIFSGGAVYFFHKFILDDIGLTTSFQVILPFALFFLLSLFMVYLAKPVIKRVSKEEMGKKKQGNSSTAANRAGNGGNTGAIRLDDQDYLPESHYATGSVPQQKPVTAPMPRPVSQRSQPTSVMPSPTAPAVQRRQTAQQVASQSAARRPAVSQNTQVQQRVSPVQRPVTGTIPPARTVSQAVAPATAAPRPAPTAQVSQPQPVAPVTPRRVSSAPRPVAQEAVRSSRVVSSVEIPDVTQDFFAKYDDPSYVERRLKELQAKEGKDS